MSETQETPKPAEQPAPGETATQDLGTEANPSTPKEPEKGEGKVEAQTPEDIEALKKELAKVTMRANQLENEAKEKELTKLKESEDWKAVAEKLQAERDEANQQKQVEENQKQAQEFREKIIAEFPEKVQKAAKSLIDRNPGNLLWSEDAADWDEAGSQLREQLDALQTGLGLDGDAEEEDVKSPKVNSNNPAPNLSGTDPSDLTFEELRKSLPRAKSRD